jgi:hypothetical protein
MDSSFLVRPSDDRFARRAVRMTVVDFVDIGKVIVAVVARHAELTVT